THKAKLEPTDAEETELYDFNSSALTFVTINAVKEQQKMIEEQKEKLEAQQLLIQDMREQINLLRSEIDSLKK
ncbi:MAG TPA: hypothetical protein PLQ76_06490, partial [bacterium]|nr:hypothetical protein [bacterium]